MVGAPALLSAIGLESRKVWYLRTCLTPAPYAVLVGVSATEQRERERRAQKRKTEHGSYVRPPYLEQAASQ
jgi:hypothetical protein